VTIGPLCWRKTLGTKNSVKVSSQKNLYLIQKNEKKKKPQNSHGICKFSFVYISELSNELNQIHIEMYEQFITRTILMFD